MNSTFGTFSEKMPNTIRDIREVVVLRDLSVRIYIRTLSFHFKAVTAPLTFDLHQ